jgi:peptide/nickel transport system substrate-binding protein
MMRTRKAAWLAAAVFLSLAPLTLGACGGGNGKVGGSMTILQTSFPDALDPALSYGAEGWQPLSQAYPGLLTYPHASGAAGAKVVPGLARSLPRISTDGLTYSLRLRKNLNFSDGQSIRASDFKASIERVIATDSPGSSLGYLNIAGAEQFAKTKKGGISGIVVNDATGDITIKLVKPRGPFVYELGIPFAGVVPKGTAPSSQTDHPPPGAGRYVIKDVVANRSYVLVKNPRFSPGLRGTPVDVGKIDRINVKIVSSPATQVTELEQNRADFLFDNPAGDRVGEVRRRYKSRYREFPTTSTFYFFMNASVPPFDKLAVRQAVNYALDFNAINRTEDGFVEPTHNILPRQVPGYESSPNLYPGPNLPKARQLIKQAGAAGAKVTVWSTDADPAPRTMAYYQDVLNELGFKTKLKTLVGSTYFKTVGDRSVKAQTGWANFIADYPHPADFLDVPLNPDNIKPTDNNDLSYNVADRGYAARVSALAQQQLTPKTEQEWAALDRYVQQQAYWAVYGTRKQSTFFSARMNFAHCKGDDWPLATHDWARFCLK